MSKNSYTLVKVFLLVIFVVSCSCVQYVNGAAGIHIGPNATVTLSGSSLNVHSGNSTGFTLEFAVRPTVQNTGYIIFFQKSGAYTCNMWGNSFRLSIQSPSGTYSFPDNNIDLAPNYWHRIAIQVSGNTARLFAGGSQVDVVVRTGDAMPSNNTSSIVFGSNWQADIDEIRVSNIARYSSAYELPTTPFTTDANTMCLFHFDEGTGTTSADASGKGCTATLNGATWTSDFFATGFVRPHRNIPVLDPSPFGTGIHIWNTRSLSNQRWPRKPYDDGINDGMANAKLMVLVEDMGCKWVRDYGESGGGSFYWPLDKGYDYFDQYVAALQNYHLNSLTTNMGFDSENANGENLRGKAPDDWTKFFNLQKEIANRYKNTIRIHKVGHEIDNTDSQRWIDTMKNYVKYLKYTHDAIKSVDSNILVQFGDLARPIGGSSWNNGEFYYADGMLNYVDEDTLNKALYEITTNGNNASYDTTSLGGFPGSKDPLDFFDGGVGVTCYTGESDQNWVDTNIDYVFAILEKYSIVNQVDIQIQENSALNSSPTSDTNANALIPSWRYILRLGKVGKVFFFHYDPISWDPSNYSKETTCVQVDFDANNDGVGDATITKYPAWYAYKKMTHLTSRLEHFNNDEFLESGGTKFYNTGWIINNISGVTQNNSELAGTTGNDPNIQFRDLVLPTYQWRRWSRPDWQKWGLNRYFTVRMRTNAGTTATLYWDNTSTTYNQSDFSNTNNSQSFTIIPDGQYHVYTVDLSQNEYWTGIVAAVRFDPTEASGASIAIDYLGFINTSGTGATKLSVSANPTSLLANGSNTSNITATVEDDAGNPVTNSTATITFSLSGSAGGTLVGTNPVQAVNGIATITYRSGTSSGTATITATSQGLTQGQTNITLTANSAPNAPINLLCMGQTNPKGLTVFTPDLSWTFSDPNTGDTQSAYRLLVADTLTNINNNNGNMWDTNKVTTSLNTVTYAGSTLQTGATYYWKVQTWDASNVGGPYSTVASFSMTQQQVQNNPPNAPSNLRCEGQVNPKGITSSTPTFTWTFSDPDTGNTQGAYRVLVADTLTNINNNNGNMWDTNKVNSSANSVVYAGSSLQLNSTYYWKVMTWDNLNTSGQYSTVASFTMPSSVATTPIVKVSTTVLDFGSLEPNETLTLSFDVTNAGAGVLEATVTSDQDWIIVDPPSFSWNATVYVTVDMNILKQTEGEYTGKVFIIPKTGTGATVDVKVTATCILVKPNPYNPKEGLLTFFGDGIVPDKTVIRIYTLGGELVKELKSSEKEIVWDGTNNEGVTVVSGIYLYIYESPKEKGIGKFTVIDK